MLPTYAHFENMITKVSPKVLSNSQKSSKTAKNHHDQNLLLDTKVVHRKRLLSMHNINYWYKDCAFSIPN